MRIFARVLLVWVAVSGWACGDLVSKFGEAPFLHGETVYGIGGWTPRTKASGDDGATSSIRRVRWNDGTAALKLNGASLDNRFPKTEGDKVRVRVALALTFPQDGGKTRPLRVIVGGAPFGEIVFDADRKKGGIALARSGNETTILLAHSEVALNSYYTIEAVIDYAQSTFDLRFTGTKRDGSPAVVEMKKVAFETKRPTVDAVIVISNASITSYFQEISVMSE